VIHASDCPEYEADWSEMASSNDEYLFLYFEITKEYIFHLSLFMNDYQN